MVIETYGYPNTTFRNNFVKKISCLNNNPSDWLIGDINDLTSSQEKFSNNKGNSTQCNKFRQVLDEHALADLECYALPYTWYDNGSCIAVVFERLYRTMENQQYLTLYKKARVENLSIIRFDHAPILLTIDNWDEHASFLLSNLKLNSYYMILLWI